MPYLEDGPFSIRQGNAWLEKLRFLDYIGRGPSIKVSERARSEEPGLVPSGLTLARWPFRQGKGVEVAGDCKNLDL